MLPVIYSMSVSLDGFIAGPDGDIGWTAPAAEQMRFHIEQTRYIAAQLCARGRLVLIRLLENRRGVVVAIRPGEAARGPP
jgi:hypothetical protein